MWTNLSSIWQEDLKLLCLCLCSDEDPGQPAVDPQHQAVAADAGGQGQREERANHCHGHGGPGRQGLLDIGVWSGFSRLSCWLLVVKVLLGFIRILKFYFGYFCWIMDCSSTTFNLPVELLFITCCPSQMFDVRLTSDTSGQSSCLLRQIMCFTWKGVVMETRVCSSTG